MAAPGTLYYCVFVSVNNTDSSVWYYTSCKRVSTKVVYGGAVPKGPITGQRVNHWLCAVFRIYAY